MKRISNLKEYFHKFQNKGMIGVSSYYLVDKMISKIDFSKDLIIVQYGVGTGVFTREILKRMSTNSHLYTFEVEEKYKSLLSDVVDDNRVTYIEDSAEKVLKHISYKVDVVVSTLPFASLPKELLPKIIESTKLVLKEGGLFLQYQYFLTDKRRLEKQFGKKITLDYEVRNFPPAFIYKIEN